MLARGKELDGDNDKLLVENQQDPDTYADMNMDHEADQPGDFNQELKDCVAEPRRVLRRESLRAWLRVQVWFSRVTSRVGSSMDSSVKSCVSARGTRMLRQSSGKSAESRQPRL